MLSVGKPMVEHRVSRLSFGMVRKVSGLASVVP